MLTLPPSSRRTSPPLGDASSAPSSLSQVRKKLQYSASVQNVLDQPASNLPFKLACLGLIFSSLFITWAWVGKIDEVAVAHGKLVPRTEARKIQPLDSGKVSRVNVQEGSEVKAGQVLMEMDTEMVQKEIDRLKMSVLSARSELRQAASLVTQVRGQAGTKARMADAEIATQKVLLKQNQANINTQKRLLAQLQRDASRQRKRVAKFGFLSKEGAISQEQVYAVEQSLDDRLRTITENQGTIKRLQMDMSRIRSDMSRLRVQAENEQLETQQRVQQQQLRMTEIQSRLRDTEALLAAAREKLKQRFVYATESGQVSSLLVKQPGEVVQTGQPLAEIAPAGQPLVLAAVLPAQESGTIKVGMPVKIKLDAFSYQDHGIIAGSVSTISPDSQAVEQGPPVYRVEIALKRDSVVVDGQTVKFKRGQTATAEVITRRKRIIDLLLDPIKKLRSTPSL